MFALLDIVHTAKAQVTLLPYSVKCGSLLKSLTSNGVFISIGTAGLGVVLVINYSWGGEKKEERYVLKVRLP